MSKGLKKLLILVSALCLIMSSNTVFASEDSDPQSGTAMNNTEKERFNPFSLFSIETQDAYTGKHYVHNSRFDGKQIKYGVDVSKYNGSIDWKAVKENGIDYAMIRVGYRSYGSNSKLYKDPNFEQNVEGALNAGLKVGVYIFSQAITEAEANEEADFVVQQIKGYNITLPVAMDYEYASNGSGLTGRLYQAGLSTDKATNICKEFCNSVKAKGYTPIVYANKNMLQNHLNAGELSSRYMIWLANYTTETDYSGSYNVWQYSSKGRVPGIDGNVDCNFWYEEFDNIYEGVDYSAVYNYQYYAGNYPDIKNAYGEDDVAALRHFVNSGMNEGRQGNEEFNVITYKNRYPDLRSAYGGNTKSYYLHYISYGKKEGRSGKGASELVGAITTYGGVDYSAVYNYQYYVGNYPDIKNVYGEDDVAALSHFVNYGMNEGRQGSNEFNVVTYKNRYSDLRNAYGSNTKSYYLHYINSGKKEGRSGKGISELVGITKYDGVDYSAVYNYQYYIENYPDIKRVYGEDDVAALRHFVNSGMNEGRQGNEEFNVITYKNKYSDLRNIYGSNLKSYYLHYIKFGKKEGRSGKGTSELVNPVTKYDGIEYSSVYDYRYYLSQNPDVETICGKGDVEVLKYFVTTGMGEGQRGSVDFDVQYYMNKYSDLRKAYGDNLKKYYLHYINYGKSEGRYGVETETNVDAVYKGDVDELNELPEDTLTSDKIDFSEENENAIQIPDVSEENLSCENITKEHIETKEKSDDSKEYENHLYGKTELFN